VVSEQIQEIIEPGRKILKAMGFYGFSCMEFKKDARDGVYRLMEVNGRHNRSGLLAVRCGINFPWLQYQHLVHHELPPASDFESGVYWISLDRDLGYGLKYRKQERYSLREHVTPYLEPHVFAVLDWRDAVPFAKRWADLARKALGQFLKRLKPAADPGTARATSTLTDEGGSHVS
jgi:predicted ATP-grasp superfamily ATP-dependent carboligase